MTLNADSTQQDSKPLPVLIERADLEYVDAEWGQLTWFANAQLGNTDYLTLGRCILYPNQANPRHYHPNCDEILTVIQGKIRHTWINGEEVEMDEGDTITIPRGMRHQARNIGTGNAVLMIAFTAANRQTIGETS
jgi:quercetin dioxygenase-like cupin family protein